MEILKKNKMKNILVKLLYLLITFIILALIMKILNIESTWIYPFVGFIIGFFMNPILKKFKLID